MCNKIINEWQVNAPWGKIGLISWGNPEMPPVLLLHGYMDTAATFTALVEKLPDNYYYVGFDMPGHGKSDSFPNGILTTKLHIVEAMRIVVEAMKWKTFIFMSHSMSFIIGVFFNNVYPGKIEKMIFLDPKPALAWYYVTNYHADFWYNLIYSDYYNNYQRINFGKRKTRSYESWINSVVRTRNLTKEQSKVVLSRSLKQAENDSYLLTWEPRAKYLAHVAIPTETLIKLMTTNMPPILVVNASEYGDFVKVPNSEIYGENIFNECDDILPQFRQVTVMGGHDFQITNSESIVTHIENFLTSNIDKVSISRRCKL